MPITIEQVIDRIPSWRGKQVNAHPLSGGLTNTNYRVEVDGTPYVVRIPGASTDLLAVDRANEYYNTQAAAEAGVGAKVVHWVPADWAAIQAKISTIEFDFWGWAVERWGRAVAKMDSAEFEEWLEAV